MDADTGLILSAIDALEVSARQHRATSVAARRAAKADWEAIERLRAVLAGRADKGQSQPCHNNQS